MTGQSQGKRVKWLRVAVVVTVIIAAHSLGGGSAQAASTTAPATSNIVLASATAQHYPVFFKVSSDGRMILSSGIAISMTCTSGAIIVWPDTFARVPIRAAGKLRASYASPTILANGTATTLRDALVGKLNSKHSQLTGTWRLMVNFAFADGSSDQCDSGLVHFTATG